MPAMFHRRVHPDNTVEPQWFPWRDYPGFYRLYNQRDGTLIAEAGVYDLASAGGPGSWGDLWGPAVSVGMIRITSHAPECVGAMESEN